VFGVTERISVCLVAITEVISLNVQTHGFFMKKICLHQIKLTQKINKVMPKKLYNYVKLIEFSKNLAKIKLSSLTCLTNALMCEKEPGLKKSNNS
jgi:hypothetical protein